MMILTDHSFFWMRFTIVLTHYTKIRQNHAHSPYDISKIEVAICFKMLNFCLLSGVRGF